MYKTFFFRFLIIVILLGIPQNELFKANASEIEECHQKCSVFIGINMDVRAEDPKEYVVYSTYVDAIEKSGAIPILIPPLKDSTNIDQVLSILDGIVMIGGLDYPPQLYGQEIGQNVKTMALERSGFDMKLMKAVLASKSMPFLGICAGCQALNIASGGTLIQDIPKYHLDQVEQNKNKSVPQFVRHVKPADLALGANKHSVELVDKSKICSIMSKQNVSVPSSHHQCVDKLGENLVIGARASDGITESIEGNSERFLIGVQWHPERDFESNKKLFDSFIDAAQKYKLKKEKK